MVDIICKSCGNTIQYFGKNIVCFCPFCDQMNEITKENQIAKEKESRPPEKKKKKSPVFESYTKHALSKKEYQVILSKCNKFEDEAMLRIAVELGLRRYDLSKIEISNIDLDNMKLTFHEQKKNRTRTLPLSSDTVVFLRKYLSTLPKNQKHLFSWGKSDHGDITAWRRLQTLCDIAGISRRPFHALRGTCYKFRKSEGWSIEQAAYLLGDDVRTAMLHYGKATDSEISELVQKSD